MKFIILYVTYPDLKTVKSIITFLLKKRLIACANIFPVKSMYWWSNKIENSNEYVSIIKTKESSWKKIKTVVQKMHPYEIPCIIKINANVSKKYGLWLSNEIR